jgi:hypothetical protein
LSCEHSFPPAKATPRQLALRNSSSSLAIFAAILLASSLLSNLAAVYEDDQASSGRWMSLKLGTLVVSKLSMIFRQTTHFAVSPSLLGTSEGVAE